MHSYKLPPGDAPPTVSLLLRVWMMDLLVPLAALPLLYILVMWIRRWRHWPWYITTFALLALPLWVAGSVCGATYYGGWYGVGWAHGRIAFGVQTTAVAPFVGTVPHPHILNDHMLILESLWPALHTWNGWTYLQVPVWLALGLTLLLLDRFLGRRPGPGQCRCGYDMTGNESGVCPECGAQPIT